MALHLSPEYREGLLAGIRNFLDAGRAPRNPYDFFDSYPLHYAWEIGFQSAERRIRERSLLPGELRRAWEEEEGALFLLLQVTEEDA